jgi:hypothetical protein
MPGWTLPKPKTTRPVKVTVVFDTDVYNQLAAFVTATNETAVKHVTLPDTVRHAVSWYLSEAPKRISP